MENTRDNLRKLQNLKNQGKAEVGIYNEEYPIKKGIEYYKRLKNNKMKCKTEKVNYMLSAE